MNVTVCSINILEVLMANPLSRCFKWLNITITSHFALLPLEYIVEPFFFFNLFSFNSPSLSHTGRVLQKMNKNNYIFKSIYMITTALKKNFLIKYVHFLNLLVCLASRYF